MAAFTSLSGFCRHSPLRKQYRLVSLSYLLYVPFSTSTRGYPCDVQVNEAANGVISSWDALVELLESIEHFLNRLDMYTRMPRTLALDEIVVKIMVELLSTLALATRELKQGRSSESVLVDVLPYSEKHSQICQKGFRREGHRGGPAEAGPTHAR